jgi:hypothetical protein
MAFPFGRDGEKGNDAIYAIRQRATWLKRYERLIQPDGVELSDEICSRQNGRTVLPPMVFDILFALVFALFVSSLFIFGFRRTSPWAGGFLLFLLVVFLATWAGGLWLAPIGAPLWGAYWGSFLIVAVVFALLLAAAAPTRPPQTRGEAIRQAEAEEETEATLSVFFWILIVVLVVAILASYLR